MEKFFFQPVYSHSSGDFVCSSRIYSSLKSARFAAKKRLSADSEFTSFFCRFLVFLDEDNK